MANELDKPQPPALPLAANEYSTRYFDQFNSVLRFFLGRVSSTFDAVLSSDSGGRFLHFPYAALYNDADYGPVGVATAISVPDTRHITDGISRDGLGIEVEYAGAYRIDVKCLANSSTAVYVFLSKNGTASSNYIADTTGYFQPINNFVQIVSTYTIELAAGDTVYAMIQPASGSVTLRAYSSFGSGMPSAEINVTFVGNA